MSCCNFIKKLRERKNHEKNMKEIRLGKGKNKLGFSISSMALSNITRSIHGINELNRKSIISINY